MGWIDRGRGVDLGPVRVRIDGDLTGPEGEGGQLPISRSFEWGTPPEARLEFLEGEAGRESWQVSRTLVLLGRSPTCRLRLPGPGVGKTHAALVRTPSGVWVVNLLFPGGIQVGGEPTRCARLEDGDEIGLGPHRIRVRLGRAARPSARSNLSRVSETSTIRSIPIETNVPADRSRLEATGGIDPMMSRLLDEFDRMHQRTTEQFQQALLMMFRMHQDQMKVIREELSRLDQLEEEQKSLQTESLASSPANRLDWPSGWFPARPRLPTRKDRTPNRRPRGGSIPRKRSGPMGLTVTPRTRAKRLHAP